jgi:3-dehydroquinate synthetase
VEPADVVPYLQRDKKRTGERVPFVLVDQPGAVTYGNEIDHESVRAAIEELRT